MNGHQDNVLPFAAARGAIAAMAMYGAFGGAAFALLPSAYRRHLWAGPIYGLATWAAFEFGLAPLLGLRPPQRRRMSERLAVIGDHVLYGLVVAGRPARN